MAARRFAAFLALSLPLLAQDDGKPPEAEKAPTRAEARAAAKAIGEAMKSEERVQILAAFRKLGLLDDRDVARAVGKGVTSEDETVRFAAVRTLRYNPNKIASSELIGALREKGVLASPELTAEVILGIGQHQDPRGLRAIIEGLGPDPEPAVVRHARIDALGRLQFEDAINEMIKFARSGFQKGLEEQIDLALRAQTGQNHGPELRPWVVWWNRGKRTWEITEETPEPPAEWKRKWAEPTPERMFAGIPGAGVDGPTTGGQGGRGGEEGGREGRGRGEGRGGREGRGGGGQLVPR